MLVCWENRRVTNPLGFLFEERFQGVIHRFPDFLVTYCIAERLEEPPLVSCSLVHLSQFLALDLDSKGKSLRSAGLALHAVLKARGVP